MPKTFPALVFALSMVVAMQAVAADGTDVMAPVLNVIDGFNRGDLKSAAGACTEDSSVIDDFPPYEWHGAGCEKWADGFKALAEKEGITDARMVLGMPRHLDVTGDRAYLVTPVTLIYNVRGKQKKLPSMFTASLRQLPGGWRIVTWAWSDL